MSNQTVSSNLNLDAASIAGLANGEDITVNSNSILTINSDNYWSQQAAVIGAISLNPGECKIDGTAVWWIPFDASSGNVPSLGTVGTDDVTVSGSNVGEFLGVFTALGVSPSAAGGAMPASGFIKLRSKSATINDNDVLTFAGGATATVNSSTGGQRGWLNIAVEETQSISASTQTSKITTTGDWFYLDNTTGSADQTIQHYVADTVPAIQIETSSGSGVYEWWLNAGLTRWGQNNRVATDARGKFFGCSSAGVITLGRTSGGVTCGKVPSSGCKVRVPNIHFSNRTSSNWANNVTPNATLASRYTLSSTAYGSLDINYITGNCYITTTVTTSSGGSTSFSITNSSYFDYLRVENIVNPITITNIAGGIYDTYNSAAKLNLINLFAGGTITNYVGASYAGGSTLSSFASTALNVSQCDSITFNSCKCYVFGSTTAATLTRANSTAMSAGFTRLTNSTFTNCVFIGSGSTFNQCSNVTITNTSYADLVENNTTQTTNSIYIFYLAEGSNSFLIDNVSIFESLTNIHPRGGIVNFATGVYDCELRNVGTSTTPFAGGSANTMSYLGFFSGTDTDCTLRRCYADNTGTAGFRTNTHYSTRAKLIDVWGDAADSAEVLRGTDTVIRGVRISGFTFETGAYGVHFINYWTSTTAGVLRLCMYPPSETSLGNELKETTGTPKYGNAAATVDITMATNDVITWEMPYFLLGATALTNTAPTVGSGETASVTKEYQIDTGSGWNGSWKTLNATNLSGETITSSTGFKLKIRYTCTTGGLIKDLSIALTTTSTDYKTQYPLPGYDVTITGLVSGTEVRAYVGTDPSTSTEIDGVESSGTSFTFNQSEAGNDGYIMVHKAGYKSIYIPITYEAANISIPVQQQIDLWYRND